MKKATLVLIGLAAAGITASAQCVRVDVPGFSLAVGEWRPAPMVFRPAPPPPPAYIVYDPSPIVYFPAPPPPRPAWGWRPSPDFGPRPGPGPWERPCGPARPGPHHR